MPLVFPKQSGGFLDPSLYLGTYVNQDPNTYAEGNWWYRADVGTIYTYINGQVLPAISNTAIFIDSNATYTNTTFTEDVVILPGVTLTIYGNITFLKNLVVLGTLQSSNPNASSSSTENNNYTMYGLVYIQGTYSTAQYNTDNINSQTTNLTIYGQGTISVAGTLIINTNITLQTLTISGLGTITINSGYTLTQSANITISISTVNINGTWANAGYTITVPSGATVTFNLNGSLTTSSTAGTLTVNGTVYWYGGISGTGSTSSVPSFTLNINGTGIFIGAPANTGTATATISLSSTSISKGSYTSSSATSSNKIIYVTLSAISGNTVGKYGLGYYLSNASTYYTWMLVYIGTANSNFSVSGSWSSGVSASSGNTLYFYNNGGSAGTITLTGTAYF